MTCIALVSGVEVTVHGDEEVLLGGRSLGL
jgi:hypothetical protein